MDFGSIFRPKLLPQTFQNPPKFDAKRHFILNFKFWSIFDRFFFDFAIFRRPGKALRYYNHSSFVAFAPLTAKCTNYQNFIPDEVQKTIFFNQKINFFHPSFDFQRHQQLYRCWHRFLCDLGPNLKPSWGPSWGHLGQENHPRAAPDASQVAPGSQNPPRPPPRRPKTPLRPPKTPPSLPKTPPKTRKIAPKCTPNSPKGGLDFK